MCLNLSRYLLTAILLVVPSVLMAEEVLIDAIIASVDGKPITLQDLNQRMPSVRSMTLNEISNSPQVRTMLDTMIMEKIIEHEAEARKVSVSASEIEEYIAEVAARNNLNREGFEAALVAEGKSIEEYKQVLKIDILKSKLTSNYVRGAVTASEEEIDDYIESNPQLARGGSKIKLSQIMVSMENKTEEEAIGKLKKALSEIHSGMSFSQAAVKYSESPDSSEGGSLGIMAETDLSEVIRGAVKALSPGEMSGVVQSPAGLHIFRLDERLNDKPSDEEDAKSPGSLREEVRKIIVAQKTQQKMSAYFTDEVLKMHTIEKKI